MAGTSQYIKYDGVFYIPLGHVRAECQSERYEGREALGSYSQHLQSTPFHSRPTLSPAKHRYQLHVKTVYRVHQ